MKDSEQTSLEEDLLRIIADQVRISPVSVVLSMAVVAYLMALHLPDQPWLWGGWMVGVVLTQWVRIYRLPKLPLETHRSPKARMREAAVINATGILWQNLSLIAFPLFTPFEASMQTLAFMGMGIGSIVTAVGWAPFAVTHIWGTLLPTFALWAWSGVFGPAGTLGILIAFVGLPYCFTLWFISKRLYRMHEELYRNRTALAEALETAESANAAKTRFLAAASHDLRQPIHTLSLFSAALGMQTLDGRTRQIADSIGAALRALSDELDALLDISKLDAGIVAVNATGFDLNALLSRLVGEFRASADEQDIELVLNCPQGAMAMTDPTLLERIVRNILTNAVTHNTSCILKIMVSAQAGSWELKLADTGVGIPLTEHKRVFEEFYQIENPERDRSKGLGLGLSIVKRLAALLKLDMRFESKSGSGTAFCFSIPFNTLQGAVVTGAAVLQTIPQGSRVLVVDDEASIREGMKVLLEALGCRVALAECSVTALALAEAERPDIALVDHRLRGSDSGLDTIDQLRKLHPFLPAIVVSGDTSPERLRLADKAGVTVLSKPVSKDVLCDAVARELRLFNADADSSSRPPAIAG